MRNGSQRRPKTLRGDLFLEAIRINNKLCYSTSSKKEYKGYFYK